MQYLVLEHLSNAFLAQLEYVYPIIYVCPLHVITMSQLIVPFKYRKIRFIMSRC